jgi:hypothetical protein
MTVSGNKIMPKKAGYLTKAIDNNREKIKNVVLTTMAEELRKIT